MGNSNRLALFPLQPFDQGVSQMTAVEVVDLEGSRDAMRPERLDVLFNAHHQRLYRLARRLSRDPEDSRDLVQETFLRAARRPGSVPAPDDQAEAWLVRVMINLCRDRTRRLMVRSRHPRPEGLEPNPSPDPERAALARATVQAGLARLAPRRWAVIVLCEVVQLPVRRVASAKALRWALKSARAPYSLRMSRGR